MAIGAITAAGSLDIKGYKAMSSKSKDKLQERKRLFGRKTKNGSSDADPEAAAAAADPSGAPTTAGTTTPAAPLTGSSDAPTPPRRPFPTPAEAPSRSQASLPPPGRPPPGGHPRRGLPSGRWKQFARPGPSGRWRQATAAKGWWVDPALGRPARAARPVPLWSRHT